MDKSHKLETVAATFLVKYFTVLIEKPEQLKNYYHHNSKVTRRFDIDQPGEYIVGSDAIHEFYLSKANKFGRVSLQTIDCQIAVSDSYFIFSSGVMIFEGIQRPFSQCFFLEKMDGSFFISNDILTIGHHEEPNVDTDQPDEASNAEESQPQLNGIHQDSEVVVNPETTTTTTTTGASNTTTTPVVPIVVEQPQQQQKEVTAAVVVDIAPTTTTTLPSSESTPTLAAVTESPSTNSPASSSSVVEEKTLVEKEHKPKSPETKTTSAANVQSKPPSYADLAKTSLPSPPPTTTTSTTTGAATVTSPTTTTTTTTTVNNNNNINNNTIVEEDIKENNKKVNHQPFTKDGCTLFFSYKSTLKFEVPHVKEAFKQFGNVLNVRILTGYGFVEFDKTESIQQVLNYVSSNNKINVAGTPLHNVELRKGLPPPPKGKSLKDKVRKDQKLENNNNMNNNNNNLNNNNQKPLQQQQQQQQQQNNNNNNQNQNNLNNQNRRKKDNNNQHHNNNNNGGLKQNDKKDNKN